MKYVSDTPAVITGETDSLDVYPLSSVKPAKPVQERTLPPLVVHPQASFTDASLKMARHQEQRNAPDVKTDRRMYCRRIEHPSYLVELRSRMERRRHRQRINDATEHVDEEI